ncbi:polyprenyl synthetase family protein [Rubrivirga sp. S365]|uniref:polyprenyl synthetase family protein n=1 Tax=Rubrivirga sp. S365 TaxID=3076080 RepID=UPI0028CAC47C|nr:polyprenyl synthetase family protein [Rubrivirga sp. S365]MDT7857932.1 polyprenyl synthetase family protein [Rubrivirga sp. S365]
MPPPPDTLAALPDMPHGDGSTGPAPPAAVANAVPVGLDALRAPVDEHLRVFRRQFRDAMRSRVGLLDAVVQYLLKRKGKQIRPTLVLLSAELAGGITERTYRAATLVELLHTATLVHDDVVDESDERRGVPSVKALWKNKVGVLLGDYLLSRGLLLALDDRDYDLLHVVSDAVRRMSEGELLQIETARRLNMTEERYFQIIADKTGSLIAACLAAGAASAGADDETVARAKAIGETIGLAFQIRDDLFDYDGAASVGKPAGLDLQDRKMTLPLIAALDAAPPAEARRVRRIVRKRRKSRAEVRDVLAFVERTGGTAAARARMEALAADAADALLAFPPSPARDALVGLCAYVVERKR